MGLTDYLALYGALLSSAVFYWNVRSAKANLRVRIVHSSWQNIEGEFEHGIRIEVQNPSMHEAHLNRVTLLYPMREPRIWDYIKHLWRFRNSPAQVGWCYVSFDLYELEDLCPVTIAAQKSHGVYVPERVLLELEKASIKPELKVMAQDALWRNEYSSAFRYREKP